MSKKRKEIDELARLSAQQNADEFWRYLLAMNKSSNDHFFFDLEMIEYQPSNFFAFHGPHFVSGNAMHERPISSHIGHTKDQ